MTGPLSVQRLHGMLQHPRHSVQVVYPEYAIGQDEDLFVIDAIMSQSEKKIDIYCTMKINRQPVGINVDTGAKCKVRTLNVFKGSATMRRLIRQRQCSWLQMAETC